MGSPFRPLRRAFSLGLRARETMEGIHEFVAGKGPPGEFPFSFRLDWETEPWPRFFESRAGVRPFQARATGVIRVGGLVTEAPCQGTIEFRYLPEGKILYRLEFSVSGEPYEYTGQKVDIRPWNLHRTHTTCYGTIREGRTGQEISRSLCRFRLRTLPSFLASFRPVCSASDNDRGRTGHETADS